ncbi:hypothetical protein P7F88_19000 [Vibrio hannami]|uniref:hypothetical protein n=1 Tax=Vibrio hannami TaxID=2717094 RepID=UPI0024109048|nr:hypothetical protein [Vibrio hannami]MDG3088052.1 hypothetical protein [Vibrio hannami]
MARKFTRIEFEGDGAVVVTNPQNGGAYKVQGNLASGVGSFSGFKGLTQNEAVNKVIERVGKHARRCLTHTIEA